MWILAKLHCYEFVVSLDKNGWSYNNLKNARLCVPDKTKIILKVFNMMQVINELRLLLKHVSRDFRYRLDGKGCNLKQI